MTVWVQEIPSHKGKYKLGEIQETTASGLCVPPDLKIKTRHKPSSPSPSFFLGILFLSWCWEMQPSGLLNFKGESQSSRCSVGIHCVTLTRCSCTGSGWDSKIVKNTCSKTEGSGSSRDCVGMARFHPAQHGKTSLSILRFHLTPQK
jgi:hypothetical protein